MATAVCCRPGVAAQGLERRFLDFDFFADFFLLDFFLVVFFLTLCRIFISASIKSSTASCFLALRLIHTRESSRLSTASCFFAMQYSTPGDSVQSPESDMLQTYLKADTS